MMTLWAYRPTFAEIGRVEVVEVTRLMLLQRALSAFGVPEPAAFFLNIIFVFYLHGIYGVESMFR
jgi:hypothetical protein